VWGRAKLPTSAPQCAPASIRPKRSGSGERLGLSRTCYSDLEHRSLRRVAEYPMLYLSSALKTEVTQPWLKSSI